MGTYFSHQNWVDAATVLTASDEAGELVVENLQNRYGDTVWRDDTITNGDPSAWFQIDFGRVREVQVLALVFPRSNLPAQYDQQAAFAATDTIRHRLSAVAAGSGELLDTGAVASGVVPGYGYHVHKLNSPVSARYWRCDLSAPSRASLGYVDVTRAWAGPVLEPAVSHVFGANYTWQSDSVLSRAARAPFSYVDPRESYRTFTLQFDWLTDAEADAVLDLDRAMSNAGQFLVVRGDYSALKGAMLAVQQRSAGIDAVAAHMRSRKVFNLVEAI